MGQRLFPASKDRFLRARLGNGSFRPHVDVAHLARTVRPRILSAGAMRSSVSIGILRSGDLASGCKDGVEARVSA